MIRLVIIPALVLLAATAAAQELRPVLTISGIVVDTNNQPIPRPAFVTATGCNGGPVDSDGAFLLDCSASPPLEGYTLEIAVRKDGWRMANGVQLERVFRDGRMPSIRMEPVPRLVPTAPRASGRGSAPPRPPARLQASLDVTGTALDPKVEVRIYNPTPQPVFLDELRVFVDRVYEIRHAVAANDERERRSSNAELQLHTSGTPEIQRRLERKIDNVDGATILFDVRDDSQDRRVDRVYRARIELAWKEGSSNLNLTAPIAQTLLVVRGRRTGRLTTTSQEDAAQASAANRAVVARIRNENATIDPALDRWFADLESFQPRDVRPGLPIERAAAANIDSLRVLLLAAMPIDTPSYPPNTPLTVAAEARRWDVVRFLIDRGANVHAVWTGAPGKEDRQTRRNWIHAGSMALWSAAQADETNIAQLLLDKGVDPSSGLRMGAQLNVVRLALAAGGKPTGLDLCMAVVERRLEVAQLLLESDAPIADENCPNGVYAGLDLKFPFSSVVAAAVSLPDPSFFHRLIERAKVRGDAASPKALARAIDSVIQHRPERTAERVAALLSHGADPTSLEDSNSMASTPEIARLLVSAGADVNSVGFFSPLGLAVDRGDVPLVQTLVELGARRFADPEGFRRAVLARLGIGRDGPAPPPTNALDIVHCRILAGADVNHRSQSNRSTPLIFAANGGDAELFRLLIENGADASPVTDYERTTALSSVLGHTPFVADSLRALIGKVNLNVTLPSQQQQLEGHTPLTYCVERGERECVRILLEAGVDVSAQGRRGAALALTTDPDIRRMLLERTRPRRN